MKRFEFIPAYIAAIILAQTLFFKFTGHPESVALFTALGAEPLGRWATGLFELITALLLIIPVGRILGGLLGVGLMLGALSSHILVVGIESNGDGGLLFVLAIVVFLCCSFIVLLNLDRLKLFFRSLFNLNR